MKSFWTCILLLLACMRLSGQETWKGSLPGGFSASAALSSQNLAIPQKLQVEINLTYPEDYKADIDSIRNHLMRNDTPNSPPFDLVAEVIGKPIPLPNKTLEQKLLFVLQPQLPGRFDLTLLDIPFVTGQGQSEKKTEIISGIFPITVTLPPFDAKASFPPSMILGLSPALPIEPEQKLISRLIDNKALIATAAEENVLLFKEKTFPWIAVVAVIAVLLSLWGLRHAPRKPKGPPVSPKSMENYAMALKNLEQLKVQPSPDPGMVDAFYVHLSQSVRFYFEEKYHVNAPTKTTPEFFREIQAKPIITPAALGLLHDFLDTTDRIKFARQQASLQDCQTAAQTAGLLIGQVH